MELLPRAFASIYAFCMHVYIPIAFLIRNAAYSCCSLSTVSARTIVVRSHSANTPTANRRVRVLLKATESTKRYSSPYPYYNKIYSTVRFGIRSKTQASSSFWWVRAVPELSPGGVGLGPNFILGLFPASYELSLKLTMGVQGWARTSFWWG